MKSKEAKERIVSIWEGGINITDQKEMLKAFAQFYGKLFTSEDTRSTMERTREKIKGIIPKKVSNADANILGR